MNTSRWAMAVLALVLGGSVALFADEPKPDAAETDAAAAPGAASEASPEATEASPAADTEPKQAARKVRLTKPWKDLSSLSDEQRAQIAAIHRKAVQEIKAVEQREREEIMALLDDGQKAELQALTDKAAAERKAKRPAGAGKKQPGAGKSQPARDAAEPADAEQAN